MLIEEVENIVIAVVFIIFGIICYIFKSIGLQVMLKKLGYDDNKLAWVPFVNLEALGVLSSEYDDGKTQDISKGKALKIYCIISWCVCGIIVLAVIVASAFLAVGNLSYEDKNILTLAFLALFVAFIVTRILYNIKLQDCVSNILKIFAESHTDSFAWICVYLGFILPFVLFSIRNNEPYYVRQDETHEPPFFQNVYTTSCHQPTSSINQPTQQSTHMVYPYSEHVQSQNIQDRSFITSQTVQQPNVPIATPKLEKNEVYFCRICGQKLLSDSIYCSKCGTKVIV